MFDPMSFLLGMLTMEFLTRSMKKSQVMKIVVGMLFLIVLIDLLLRIGAFPYIEAWLNG